MRACFVFASFVLAASSIACSSSSPAPASSGSDAGPILRNGGDDGGPADSSAPDVAPPTPTCESYCSAVLDCNTNFHPQYANLDTCMAECALFPVGTWGDTGDTLGCRAAHAQASLTSPDTECASAGPTGGGVCGARCDAFCLLATAACGDRFNGNCASTCAGWSVMDAGVIGEMSGNTLDCRETEVQAAFDGDTSPDASDGCSSVGSNSAQCQ